MSRTVKTEPAEPARTDPVGSDDTGSKNPAPQATEREIGGRRSGLDPTRYGDWEKNGRCIDF